MEGPLIVLGGGFFKVSDIKIAFRCNADGDSMPRFRSTLLRSFSETIVPAYQFPKLSSGALTLTVTSLSPDTGLSSLLRNGATAF